MSQSDVSAVLHQALSPVVAAHTLLLEDVRVRGGGRHRTVTVVVDLPDGPGGVSSDQLDEVSRAVSAHLDGVDDLLTGPYRLEVTTPGISRPLTEPRHFRRAQGRLVTVTTTDGSVQGRVLMADDDGLQIQAPPTGRGAGPPEPVLLAWEQVQRGTVEVEFSPPG